MNIENLTKLADYLESRKLRAFFNMRCFGVPKDRFATECGSVGCAVGHGPYAGIPKTSLEGWFEYSFRVFGIGNPDDWMWCFDENWQDFQPSAAQAAQRIRYLIKNGHAPDNWKYTETIEGALSK